jgi:transposase-like protein
MADWVAIGRSYVTEGATYAELAATHGVAETTLRQRSKRGGWTEKRHALSQAVTEKVAAKVVDQAVDQLGKINEADLKLAAGIRQQIAKNLNAAAASNSPMPPLMLRQLAGAHEAAQRVSRLALGATTENTGVSGPDGGPVQTESLTEEKFEAIARRLLDEV